MKKVIGRFDASFNN